MTIMAPFDPAAELSEDVRTALFVDGAWRRASGTAMLDLVSPVSEEVFLSTPAADDRDIDTAVAAARTAFDDGPWPRMQPAERAAYLRRIGEAMAARAGLLQRVWMAQVGVTQGFSSVISTLVPGYFELYAGIAETFAFETERPTVQGSAKIIREPVGVCALIVPWNAPLVLLVQKLAAALACGCTVVVKPSPETPLDALILAECVAAAGLPPGVVNVVPAGRETGDYLIRKPEIDKVSFTGSTAVGKHIAAVCSERLARVSLELGGKSAAIICDDADLNAAIPALTPFTMPFSGQICFSQTRVLVSKKRHDEVLEHYATAVKSIRVGDPWDDQTDMGPLAMKRQLDRVRGYVETAHQEGARLVTGGGNPEGLNRGYFIEPTIFDGVTPDMTIAREEVFGPVVSVMAYEDEADAIRIANNSDFGLSGSVYSTDIGRAESIARRVRTGNISVNMIQLDPTVPFGGFKQSGLGREGGVEGLEPYLETKAIFLPPGQ